MTKPKVAIFIVGQPRYLNGRSYRSIKEHLIDRYDCDFYCHYWYDDGKTMLQPSWYNDPVLSYDRNTEDIIKSLYNPKAYAFDAPPEYLPIYEKYKPYKKSSKDTVPYGLYCYYQSMKKCADLYLKYKEKAYDYFIKLRYDIVLQHFPDLNECKYDEKSIILSAWHGGQALLDCNTMISKDEEVFLRAMSIYECFDDLCNESNVINDEQIFYQYFSKKQIPYLKIPFDVLLHKLPNDFNFCMI
jgi:hypothetical protein